MADSVFEFGEFRLDIGRCELLRHGHSVRLERKPLELLILLATSNGRLVSRDEMADRLWGDGVFVDTEHGINSAMWKIRASLHDNPDDPRFIQTVPGRGYRFIADVEPVLPDLVAKRDGTLLDEQEEGEQQARVLDPHTVAIETEAPSEPRVARKTGQSSFRRWRWLLAGVLPFIVVALVCFWIWRRRRPTYEPIRSLAVLPLDDLSPGTREGYFADGMTDEMITELARIPGLRVVSRTSVMQNKGSREPLAQIARELNVDAVVEGSVVRSGDRVRITAQLIDARSDKHLWAQSFEGPGDDILSLQDSVAREICLQTSAALTPAAKAELTTAKPINPAAYDAYLRGLYFIQRRDADLAVSYFHKAVALEPDYGAAHAGLAEALVVKGLSSDITPDEIIRPATAGAKRAIELDPYDGQAYTALGGIEINYLWDWDAAERNVRKGIELSPSSSDAEIWLAIYLTSVGRPSEAVDATRRAVLLDPFSFWANRLLGSMLYYSRHYDESLAALERASELAPDKFQLVDGWKSGIFEMQGRYSDAFAADMKDTAPQLSPADIRRFRSAFETGGWKAYQEARVEYLLPRSVNNCYMNYLALSYVRLGNSTEAFRWLNRDLDNHCGRTVFDLSSDPRLDSIRQDPRFAALLHRVNLPY